jgi:hypothetical protein
MVIRILLGVFGLAAVLSAKYAGELGARRWEQVLGREIKGVKLAYHVSMTLAGLAAIVWAIVWPPGW